ncbi:MAG: PAS domain-containing protein [Alphaproteobacteria bacterium]|nr:PAS domain-containing protein [Alphaproteobacteria bacterium]
MHSDVPKSSTFDVPPWFYADMEMGVQDQDLRDVLAYWENLKEGQALPNASLVDPLDLRKHLGNLFMVRVGQNGEEFVYSLIGTTIAEVLDRDSTGRRVEETFPKGHPIADIYRLIYKQRRPVRTHGQLNWVNKD